MRNRLHSICPYFAMFPEDFAEEHITNLTSAGDYVFDPFSGRGTTLLQALLMNRKAIATDINPVAYCISAAKASVPSLSEVIRELQALEDKYNDSSHTKIDKERHKLPPFYRRAFYYSTLNEILFLRGLLNWRVNKLHRFITALVLGSLHGEMDRSSSYFSNQMPRTISTKPQYSLKYWSEKNLWPKKRDVFEILKKRAEFRLTGTRPKLQGRVALLDSRNAGSCFNSLRKSVKAVITSPPYLNVTNYEEDQWLRLWFLGYDPFPTYGKISKDDRYSQKDNYWSFLSAVWTGIAPLLKNKAWIVCRLGAVGLPVRELTRGIKKSLSETFPRIQLEHRPYVTELKNRQTDTFRPGSTGCKFEVDYVFSIKN